MKFGRWQVKRQKSKVGVFGSGEVVWWLACLPRSGASMARLSFRVFLVVGCGRCGFLSLRDPTTRWSGPRCGGRDVSGEGS